MDLTVIVCTYNRCQFLAGNLEALARQVTAPELSWEVVIVDNNCTDDTAKVVDAARAKFSVPLRWRRSGKLSNRNIATGSPAGSNSTGRWRNPRG